MWSVSCEIDDSWQNPGIVLGGEHIRRFQIAVDDPFSPASLFEECRTTFSGQLDGFRENLPFLAGFVAIRQFG